MTEDKNFKRIVRARMKRTGESYSAARATLLRRPEAASSGTRGVKRRMRRDLQELLGRPQPSSGTGCLAVLLALLHDGEVTALLDFFGVDTGRLGRDATLLLTTLGHDEEAWPDSRQAITHWAGPEADARRAKQVGPLDVLMGMALAFVEVSELLSLHHLDMARLRQYAVEPPDVAARRAANAVRSYFRALLDAMEEPLVGDVHVVVDVWREPLAIDLHSPRALAVRIIGRQGARLRQLEQELSAAIGRPVEVFVQPEKT